jgi:hypothetical protein
MSEISLYQYQEQYIAKLPMRGIVDAELGLGKSIMSLEYYKRHNQGEPLLIVAPAAKTRSGDWERECKAVGITDYRLVSRERLATAKIAGKPLWHQFVPKFGGMQHSVIYDENVGLRNASTSIFKKIKIIVDEAPIFLILTGTPMSNGWKDMTGYAVLFKLVRNQTEFKQRFFIISRAKPWPEIVGYYHEDVLHAMWKKISRHLTREDAKQYLPDRQILPLDIQPMGNDLKEYDRLKKEKTIGDNLLDTASAVFHAQRQALADLKLDQLEYILNDTNENVIIWYNYKSELVALKSLLKGFKEKTVYEVNGDAHTAPSKPEWANIRNSVTLCQYKSASRGIELVYATIAVYFSPTYSAEEYSQSLGRNHRNGTTKPTIVYCMRVQDTMEVDIWNCLKNKKNFIEKLYLEKHYD